MKKLRLLISCLMPFLFSPFGLANNTYEEDMDLTGYKTKYNAEYQRMIESGEEQHCNEEGGQIIPAGETQMPVCIISFSENGIPCQNSDACRATFDEEFGYGFNYEAAYQEMVENGEVQRCVEERGKIAPAGMSQMPFCHINYADAGMACKDSNDCMGDCITRDDADEGEPAEGQCKANNNPFGCFTYVENGVVDFSICMD